MTVAPRFARLARMVLHLGRIALSTLTFGCLSACVLPLAPDFQDPPAAENFAPIIINAQPPVGSIVTRPSFLITVSDPNVGDDLAVRWIADFPPFTDNTQVLLDTPVPHSADGLRLSKDVTVAPDCVLNSLAKIPRHQIMVVVADRAFEPPRVADSTEIDLARLPQDGRKIVATWTLEMECK